MTSQGTAYGRFRRSLDAGQVLSALAAAAELPAVTLEDALELCLLLAEEGHDRYLGAARRWLSRFAEERGPSINEILMAGSAFAELAEIPSSPVARDTLRQLIEL